MAGPDLYNLTPVDGNPFERAASNKSQVDPLSQPYVDAVKRFEGFTPHAAWDVNNYRNGYGTNASHKDEVISEDEATNRLNKELGSASEIVDKTFPNLAAGPRAALTSLTYNAGSGWMAGRLGKAVANGDMDSAKELLKGYNRSAGKVLPGLTDRRNAEAQWFDKPLSDDGTPSAAPRNPATPSPAAVPSAPSQDDQFLFNLLKKGTTQQPKSLPLPTMGGPMAFVGTNNGA